MALDPAGFFSAMRHEVAGSMPGKPGGTAVTRPGGKDGNCVTEETRPR